MKCIICEIIKAKQNILFEDDDVYSYIEPEPISPGQITLVPKKHIPIFELVPDDVIGKIFSIANKLSMKIFESFNAQGTNILINNGISAGQFHPHFSINIIPRKEKDGINFSWNAKKLSEEDLSSIELQYKQTLEEKPKQKPPQEQPEPTPEKNNAQKVDYELKQLDRIP